jgi:hypothetical protein
VAAPEYLGATVTGSMSMDATVKGTPPDSEMDTELVFGQLMNAVAALLN